MRTMTRSAWLAAALTFTLLTIVATGSSADNASATFQYWIGTGLLCGEPGACPDISRAASGDTIEFTGTGSLSVHPKAVDGGGTFVHHAVSGDVNGTWTAEQLLSFKSYGSQPDLPSTFEGGLALIAVQLTAGGGLVADGILQVSCTVGEPPAGADEGIRLALREGPNFNKEISGHTLFIRQ
jgi:hypothetical protein